MRTHEVRQAIIDAVEGITPDAKASRADKFYLVPVDVAELQRDRAFSVQYIDLPTQTGRLVLTVDSVEATFELSTAYLGQGEPAHVRVGQDADLILDALQGLEASPEYSGQITLVEVEAVQVEYVQSAGMMIRHTLRVEFDPRDP